MRIAVLSGKGGTGKTFVAVNLSCAADQALYVDCDVEEPNGRLFLKPDMVAESPITVMVPNWNMDKCSHCRKCVDFCRYNALALIKDKLLVFYEVCHSCGGCMLFCPEKAITEQERTIGVIQEGKSGNVRVLTGCLNIGEVSGVPIIKGLMNKLPAAGDVMIDCPPGSACLAMESIRAADYCLLVAEPTLFGLHNLSLVYDLVRLFGKPLGVVLNKCLPGDSPAERFCADRQIAVLAKIPYDEKLGKLNSAGHIAVRESKRYQKLFQGLLKTLKKEAVS